MGLFDTPRKKRKSPRAILNALKRRIAKKKRIEDKKKEKLRIRSEIARVRKQLRGY